MAYANRLTACSSTLCRLKPINEDQPFASSNLSIGYGHLLVLGMTISSSIISVYMGYEGSQVTGSSVVFSIIISCCIAFLSALCYAEFSTRLPKVQGSAYSYTYIAAGEFPAFIIGWTLIMEYVVGIAVCASTITQYLNTVSDGQMEKAFVTILGPINIPGLSSYLNIIAFLLTCLCGVFVGSGIRILLPLDIMSVMALASILFIITCGAFYGTSVSWDSSSIVFTHNFYGVLIASGSIFFAFSGLDIIATTGAEVNNPVKQLAYISPLMIILVLVVTTVTTAITLSMYNVVDLQIAAPSQVFIIRSIPFANLVILPGIIASLIGGACCCLFAIIRIAITMAKDGLIPPWFGILNKTTETPLFTISSTTLIAAFMAMLLSTATLINMTSIGTLLACATVAICVIILRYRPSTDLEIVYNSGEMEIGDATVNQEIESDEESEIFTHNIENNELSRRHSSAHSSKPKPSDKTNLIAQSTSTSARHANPHDYHQDRSKRLPTYVSSSVVNSSLACYFFLLLALDALVVYAYDFLLVAAWWVIVLTIILAFTIVAAVISLIIQPQTSKKVDFMVPLVPVLPLIAIFCYTLLLVVLPGVAWIRFSIWLLVGLPLYFFYGIRNSWQGRMISEPAECSIQIQD
ncbi:putative cationic amino acid transporter [Trichoplax sp. H2]|nr:putative cationic amino acid transporter [Trichoplax sp. H2]|eukprot:RDD41760.1 putative cationic amino acid transporter [Trichoplax sp. H2]